MESAKRSWAVDWMDMDELLVRLWGGRVAQKILVLNILTMLSEDVFTTEDSAAALRGSDLNRACVEIFVPTSVLAQQFPHREGPTNMRCGSEGWLSRMSDALEYCTTRTQISGIDETFALKLLSMFRSSVSWVIPRGLIYTSSVQRICASLAVSSMPIQLVRRS